MTFASSAFAETSPGTTLVPGEFLLTTEDFKTISQAIYADAGIFMPESKATLVYSRLARRLRALGIESFKSYCDLIKSQAGVEERQRMLAALTTNVTRFFREGHHFEHLRKSFLPGALARAKRGESIRIWSAGCSNGQEAYTMALVILDMLPNAADLDIRILASDIDPNVLEEGRAGVYDETALADVSADLRRRFFTTVKDGPRELYSVSAEMRRLVSFRELNLFAQWPMRRKFDIVFCRNVAIYFDHDHQANLWNRFASVLVPGGFLYIGHSERLSGPAAEVFTNDGITTWCLAEA